jgi:AbrB family looped-hinge helix DNA binding protein
MLSESTKIAEGGRVVIPAAFRKELGLRPGDELIMRIEEGGIRLETYAQGLRRVQAMVAKYIPRDGRSLVDELIAERRAEAAREDQQDSVSNGA